MSYWPNMVGNSLLGKAVPVQPTENRKRLLEALNPNENKKKSLKPSRSADKGVKPVPNTRPMLSKNTTKKPFPNDSRHWWEKLIAQPKSTNTTPRMSSGGLKAASTFRRVDSSVGKTTPRQSLRSTSSMSGMKKNKKKIFKRERSSFSLQQERESVVTSDKHKVSTAEFASMAAHKPPPGVRISKPIASATMKIRKESSSTAWNIGSLASLSSKTAQGSTILQQRSTRPDYNRAVLLRKQEENMIHHSSSCVASCETSGDLAQQKEVDVVSGTVPSEPTSVVFSQFPAANSTALSATLKKRTEETLSYMPAAPLSEEATVGTSAKHKEHYVRTNLRNSAGACRGRRKTKVRNSSWKDYLKKNEGRSKDFTGAPHLHKNGTDPVDDYLDGMYTATSTAKKSRCKDVTNSQRKSHSSKNEDNDVPCCSGHQYRCKLITVKHNKNGNKGRKFFSCAYPRGEQCDFFQWKEDTVEATRRALQQNGSYSAFIVRQVTSYVKQWQQLTIPELTKMAQRRGLDVRKCKKEQLVARLAVWVRDELAASCREVEGLASQERTTIAVVSQEDWFKPFDENIEAQDAEDHCESVSSDDEVGYSSEELELVGTPINESSLSKHIQSGKLPVSNAFDPHSALHNLFGHEEFRSEQEWAIQRCLDGHRSLLVAPTGFGKSLCYALPAALMDGVCIVVSPLLSLIHDQIRSLPPRVPSATLSGQMSSSALATTLDDIIRGRIKIVFVSPERLASLSFRRLFRRNRSESGDYERRFPNVSLLCVDEAHCLSQWAHNFRPSYLRLPTLLEMIRPVSVLAITATAGPLVVQDICRALYIPRSATNDTACQSKLSQDEGVRIMNVDRDNIDVRCSLFDTQGERLNKVGVYPVLVEPTKDVSTSHLLRVQLMKVLSKKSVSSESDPGHDDLEGILAKGNVIVYVWRQKDAEVVAENIQAAGTVKGGVVVYHGGMSSESRQRAQQKYMRGKARICVATVAFGLGIDKADIDGIVHLYLSASPEHYIQEIGRAGRDGRQAVALAMILRDEFLVRTSLAHADLVSSDQIGAIVAEIVMAREKARSVMLLEKDSNETSLCLSLPLQEIQKKFNCRKETIETILCLLEQSFLGNKPLVTVDGVSYDRVILATKRRPMAKLAEHEDIGRAILQCATPIDEQSVNAASSLPSSWKQQRRKADLPVSQDSSLDRHDNPFVGSSFGSFQFSVAQCCNCLYGNYVAEPRHVFSSLRRLESQGELAVQVDTPAIHLRWGHPNGIESTKSESSLTAVCARWVKALYDHWEKTVYATANKVLDLDTILKEVESVCPRDAKSRFQELTRLYFSDKGLLRSNENEQDKQRFGKIPSDLLPLLRSTIPVVASPEASPELQASREFQSLAITKFLHGIDTSASELSPSIVRQHPLFGCLQSTRFPHLLAAVREHLG